jgi:hypothetical protein
LEKIKAHSGNRDNEFVDKMVKINETNWLQYDKIRINREYLNGINLIPTFKDKIIDEPIKDTIKSIHKIAAFSK